MWPYDQLLLQSLLHHSVLQYSTVSPYTGGGMYSVFTCRTTHFQYLSTPVYKVPLFESAAELGSVRILCAINAHLCCCHIAEEWFEVFQLAPL